MLFFFNQAGAVYDPDVQGIELATISDARIQAVKFAAQMLTDSPDIAWLGDEYRVEVTDENQLALFTFIALGVDAAASKGMA